MIIKTLMLSKADHTEERTEPQTVKRRRKERKEAGIMRRRNCPGERGEGDDLIFICGEDRRK